MNRICIMIPVTSRNRKWKCFSQTDLYNIFLKSFFLSLRKEENFEFLIVLAIDDDDRLFKNYKVQQEIINFVNKRAKVEFISTNGIKKGFVGEMWNRCFEFGIQENYDYFLQIGDDVEIINKGWCEKFIEQLKKKNDIGVIGFADRGRMKYHKEDRLITQSFVSKIHYEIFGSYFPKEIANWYIDNWLTEVYQKNGDAVYDLRFGILNRGGEPRYPIVVNREMCANFVERDFGKINDFKASSGLNKISFAYKLS